MMKFSTSNWIENGKHRKKKVKLKLIGINGNMFAILGAFQKQARREGWTKHEIDLVTAEATDGDYDHLLSTIMAHCENDGIGPDEDEDEDDED